MNTPSDETVFTTTVYSKKSYRKEDRIVTDIFDNDIHKTVVQLCQALEPFIVESEIVNSKREKLRKHLENLDYEKYYKTLYKMLGKILKEFKQC